MQLSVVFAMLGSQDRAEELLNIANTDVNAALDAQEEWANSLEAKFKELGNAATLFWQTFLDQETIAFFVEGLTNLINLATTLVEKFGSLAPTVMAITSSYTVFNRHMREGITSIAEGLIPSLGSYNQKLADEIEMHRTIIGVSKLERAEKMQEVLTLKASGQAYKIAAEEVKMYNSAIAQSTAKMIGCRVAGIALQAVLSVGVSAAISGAIYLFQKFISESETLSEKIDKTIDSMNELRSEVSKAVSIEENLAQYEKLNKELELVVEGSEKEQQLLEKIESIRQTISSEDVSMEAIINNENLTLEKQLALMQEINKERVRKAVDKFEDENNQKDITKLEEGMFYNLDLWKGQAEALKEARESGSDVANWGGQLFDVQLLTQKHEELTEKLKSQYSQWEEINSQIQYFDENGVKVSLTLSDLDDETRELLDGILLSTEAMEGLKNKTKEQAEVVRKTPEQVKALNEKYVEACSNLEEARELLDNINENGMNLDNAKSVMDMFEDFVGNISDTAQVQEFLNDKIREMADAQSEAYTNMIREDEEFWENKMKNSDEWQTFVNSMNESVRNFGADILGEESQDYINFMNTRAAQREIDYQNAKTMGEAERILSAGVVNDLSDYFAGLVDDKGVYRGIDYSNVIEFLNSQGAKEAETVQQLRDLWNKYYTQKAKALDTELKELEDKLDVVYEGDRENVYGEMMALNKQNQQMQNLFKDLDASFKGVSGGLNQSGAGLKKPSSSSSSSSGSGSSSSSEVADLELTINRYHDLEDALNDVEKALKKNQVLQKTATPTEKVKLMKEEIELYKQQQKLLKEIWDEQKKETAEIKQELMKQGFIFDQFGNIQNYTSQLIAFEKKANALSGTQKEATIEAVEAVVDLIEQYEKLTNETLPNSESSYLEMMDAIKQAEKERLEYITDVQKQISDAIKSELEKRTEAIKKQIEKERDLYNSTYDEETYEADLRKEQRKLDELKQQIANVSRDTSLAGQLKLQQLMDEYEAQQEIINNMIRENEHQKGDQAFQDALDKADEKLEEMLDPKSLANLVNQALTTGFVTLNGEIVEVSNLLVQMLEDSGDLFTAVGETLKSELIDSLIVAKELMMDISSLTTTRSVDLGVGTAGYDLTTSALQSRSLNLASGSIGTASVSLTFENLLNIEGNLDHTILGEVQVMLDEAQNQIIHKVSRALTTK